ncbi:MAG: LPXTG cell wall anchor domain-containing protein [Candidatus Marinimicrobia bacterium]|nr:LPXTG cell wall anchor domain-containing protein [Candidatus Neomarinimicrobiota bacterium]
MSIYIDKYTLILILVGILLLLIAGIALLLRIKKRHQQPEPIPGVEEMAKTTFFWADYHRGKIGEEASPADRSDRDRG